MVPARERYRDGKNENKNGTKKLLQKRRQPTNL